MKMIKIRNKQKNVFYIFYKHKRIKTKMKEESKMNNKETIGYEDDVVLSELEQEVMIKVFQTRYYKLYENYFDILGFCNFVRLVNEIGSEMIYIGKIEKLLNHYRDQNITEEFYETSPAEISEKYNVPRCRPYRAINNKRHNQEAGRIYTENEARKKLNKMVECIRKENELEDNHSIEDIREFVKFILENEK